MNFRTVAFAAVAAIVAPAAAFAESAEVINVKVKETLEAARLEVSGFSGLEEKAAGVLVIPNVVEGGFVIGGKGGEGALVVDGAPVGYYTIGGASVGLQAGVDKYNVIMAFMTDEALAEFRNSKGWEAGATGKVTFIDAGAAGAVDTTQTNKPIIAMVTGQKGLMAGVNVEGAKSSKVER